MLTFRRRAFWPQGGATMIEVLITIVILAFGLLGLVGLQAKVQLAEVESYQRAQAVVLLNDMADRLNALVEMRMRSERQLHESQAR